MLRPTTTLNPCLGDGKIELSGKPVSDCSFLTYEDFSRLINLEKG